MNRSLPPKKNIKRLVTAYQRSKQYLLYIAHPLEYTDTFTFGVKSQHISMSQFYNTRF